MSKEEIEYKTHNLNLRRDQVQYLKTLDNASEFVRNAIDKAIKKPKEKPEHQVKKKFSAIEQQIIAGFIKEANQICNSMSDNLYSEYEKPFRYSHKSDSWYRKKWRVLDLLEEAEKTETKQYQYLKKCSEKRLLELYDEATLQWIANYPEHWRKHITPKWTLGDVMFELRDQDEVTMHEVAAIMRVSYQCVSNKVRPLLEAEDKVFVKKQMEHRKLIQTFDLDYLKKLGLEEKRLKRYSEDFDKLAWQLSQQGLNATQISKLLGVYPAFVRKRIQRYRKKLAKTLH